MIINLAGTSFLSDKSKEALRNFIKVGDLCEVYQRNSDSQDYDADYEVICRGYKIGWIPKLATLKRYLGTAIDEKNRDRHDKEYERYKITEKIRGQITLDIHRNNTTPLAIIENIWEGEHNFSISVKFS